MNCCNLAWSSTHHRRVDDKLLVRTKDPCCSRPTSGLGGVRSRPHVTKSGGIRNQHARTCDSDRWMITPFSFV